MTNNKLLDANQRQVYENFRSTHWLSKKENVEHFYLWNTFYRRNLHLFAKDYFGLKLHLYQQIILYLMGISNFIVIIATRAGAKSYIIAIYTACRSVLYPNSSVVLTSGTRGQARLIVSKKIQGELMPRSPNLRREIEKITDSQAEVKIKYRNGSETVTVTCNENARGNRSTVNVSEEAREINKGILDKIISPFQFVRPVEFMKLEPYCDDPQFQEEPTDIYISSSIEESHWLYSLAKDAFKSMLDDKGGFFLAFDYSITLKHGIRTRAWLTKEFKKIDPITRAVEYENLVLRSNANAYFSYDLLKKNQVLKRAFYPRLDVDVISKTKNKYDIPKIPGEIRVISADIAAIDRSINDNSVYSCLRLFPEAQKETVSYRVQVPYLEALRGCEISKQALRIRQLYEDFKADYIVLDLRNIGVAVYDCLARVMYDDARLCEYAPLRIMNDADIAKRINNPNAPEVIFGISASAKLNSDIAVNLRYMLTERLVDLLIPKDEGIEECEKYIKENQGEMSAETQLFFESPYLETMLFVSETSRLTYEKADNTGIIRVKERGTETKDRYTSVGYGCYFAMQLARDLLSDSANDDLETAVSCVSSFSF